MNMVPVALDRATALIAELADGKIAKGAIDAYPTKIAERQVVITLTKTNAILGLELKLDDVSKMLNSIGLAVSSGADAASLSVAEPSEAVSATTTEPTIGGREDSHAAQ